VQVATFSIIMSKKITYLESYVDWVRFHHNNAQKHQCTFCSKVLGNGSMKPLILKAHFISRQPRGGQRGANGRRSRASKARGHTESEITEIKML